VIPAVWSVQRPRDARLLYIDAFGRRTHLARSTFVRCLQAGDLVVGNDAATIPASLSGCHIPTGAQIEVRLAGRRSLSADDIRSFSAVVFGTGDFRTPTELRPPPPRLAEGDRLALGPLSATVAGVLAHPRLVALRFDGSPDAFWAGIARHGRPIQYAHLPAPLELWDVWTVIAGPLVAFEPPSAGFMLDWQTLATMHQRGIEFATLTHAAGISSTGDTALDARLPFDEPYAIPDATAAAIARARAEDRRIVAIGTTVVRALEHAAAGDGRVRAGEGLATERIGASTRLQVVDAMLSGVHEPGTSHYELLRAFVSDEVLERASESMSALGYRTHEFGDSVLIERDPVGFYRVDGGTGPWNGSRFQSRNVHTRFHESRCSRVFSGCQVLGSTRRSNVCPPGGLS
jgi:S-adenosylmethionine:tRNA ribosyltransferase-isomerase